MKRATLRLAVARLVAILLGTVGVAWGAASFPTFWRELPIERASAEIVDRTPLNPDALLTAKLDLIRIEGAEWCRPGGLEPAAIIRVRLAEIAIASGKLDVIDERLSEADSAVRHALSCVPRSAFLWTALAWLDLVRRGFDSEQLEYLRLSYKAGANEGWVATRRNRLALSIFAELPPDLAECAVQEFARMVDSTIYWDTINTYAGSGWAVRKRLLAGLRSAGPRQREAFANGLYAQGFDVVIPGTPPRDPRPWY
jgi:hypothetical protein